MDIPEQSGHAESLQRMRDELLVRDRISRSFLTATDDDVYGEVLDAVLEAMRSPCGVSGYLDENGDLVCPSLTRAIFGLCPTPQGSAAFPRSSWRGILGRSLLEGRAVYSNKGPHEPEGNVPAERALSAPVLYRGRVIGLLAVAGKAGDYNEEDRARLEDIAGFVAPFLDARLQRDRQEKLRRATEEALRLSEERNRAIFQNALDGLWIVDTHGRFVDVNETYCRLVGYSRDELLGMGIADVEALECQADVIRHAERIREAGSLRFESKHRSKEGRLIDIEASVTFLPRSGLFFVIIRDITEPNRAESALRESEAGLAAAQRIAHIGSWEWNIEADTASWSEETYRLFGQAPGELGEHRKKFVDMVHPDDRLRVDQALTDTLSGIREYDLEYRILLPDGTEKVIHAQAEVSRKENGKPVLMRGTVHEITERKMAEEALRLSESRLRQAQELSHTGSFWRDLVSDRAWWSEELYRICGLDPSQPSPNSERLAAMIHPDDVAYWRTAAQRAAESGGNVVTQYRLIVPDGGVRWHYVVSGVRIGARGEPIEIAGTVQDVTELERAKEERDRLEAQLSQARKLESIGRLAGGIAHDFNNLLTVISGYGDLVQGRLIPDDPLYLQVQEIRNAAKRATDLTMQLLAFSRKQVLQVKVLSLNDAVRDAEKMLRRVISEDIELVCVLDQELWLVEADPGQLHQVIMNLALNARDAMPDGGKLTIESANARTDETCAECHARIGSGKYVMLTVRDTGKGMDAATVERIFEPFFTTKDVGKGTGLGLATVYGIVQQSGGHISVSSAPNRGASFSVHLPAAEKPAPKEQLPEPPEKGTGTILLVEDQTEVRRFVAAVLNSYGYRVLEASDGEEAMRICQSPGPRIDLLVTDVVMPRMRGPELAAHVHAAYPDLRVLYISGYTDLAITGQIASEPGSDYLQKPFTPHALARKVHEILTRRSAGRANA
jgi:PAS domain S-box-containing protein